MNKKNYLLLLLIFKATFIFAQNTFTDRVEVGMSLFSLTNEIESNNVGGDYRYTYGGLLNGFIFKYHKERYSFRIHLRFIGVQGTEVVFANGPDIGNNYEDVGFQIGTGIDKIITNNKRFQWYLGGELFVLKVKEADFYTGRPQSNSTYNAYTMGGLNIINGFRLKASRHLSFTWEMNGILGILTRINQPYNNREWIRQSYFNQVGIFGATISWNKKKN